MNLQLDHVVSDTPARPACGLSESLSHQSRRAGTYWDVGCHSSIETIRAALVSNDPIAGALRRLSGKMLYCDRKLELLISALNAKRSRTGPKASQATRKDQAGQHTNFDVRTAVYCLLGVNLTRIRGLGPSLALKLIAVCDDLRA